MDRSKTSLSPKAILKNRIARNKLMKIPPYGSDLHMEEIKPALDKKIQIIRPGTKSRPLKKIENIGSKTENPFDLPNRMRTFYQKKIKKRTKGEKTEPFIMSEPLTICDIDETFYKIIEGRPLRQRMDIKVYMTNLRDITLWRTNAAFANDGILQIEQKYAYELHHYNKIFRSYEKNSNAFVQFVKESYQDAKRIQDIAEENAMQLAIVSERLENHSFKYVKVRNRVGHMMFLFDTLSMYRRFLFSISPFTWRKEHDPLFYKDVGTHISFIKLDASEYVLPAMTSAETFREKLCPDEKAILYFKEPKQLLSVFDELRKQCLTYVEIDVVTSRLVKSVVKSRDQVKSALAKTVKDLKEWVISDESEIIFLEERATSYKEAFEKLLMSEFQKLYSSHENVKLFTCVQYVYLRIIGGHEEPKDSVVTLMRDIENLYCDLNLKLDNLNQEVVKAAKKEMFDEDIRIMNKAHKAQRVLNEYNILSKALYASFEPPRNKIKNTISAKNNRENKSAK